MRALSVIQHKVGVNMGDHAQDVIRAFAVGENETVAEVAERLLTRPGFSFASEPERVPEYDNWIEIRIAEPSPEQEEGEESRG